MTQLGKHFVHHLTKFWVNYNALKNRTFDVLGVYGPDRAADALEQATRAGLISKPARLTCLRAVGCRGPSVKSPYNGERTDVQQH